MSYTEMFKRKMVQKLTGPDAISAWALSKQVDVPQPTLSTWLRKAGIKTQFWCVQGISYRNCLKLHGCDGYHYLTS